MRDRRALTRVALVAAVVAAIAFVVRRRSRSEDAAVPPDVRAAVDEGAAAGARGAASDGAEWIPIAAPDGGEALPAAAAVPADGAGLVAPA